MNKYLKFGLVPFLLVSNLSLASQEFFKTSNNLGHQAMFHFFNSSLEIEEGLKSKDINIQSKALIACLVAWEHADGINGIETSSMFMDIWVTNPKLLSTWFYGNSVKKERWFETQPFIFNGLSEIFGTGHAKDLRDNMIKTFKSLEDPGYGEEKFFKEYIQVLLKVEFHGI